MSMLIFSAFLPVGKPRNRVKYKLNPSLGKQPGKRGESIHKIKSVRIIIDHPLRHNIIIVICQPFEITGLAQE